MGVQVTISSNWSGQALRLPFSVILGKLSLFVFNLSLMINQYFFFQLWFCNFSERFGPIHYWVRRWGTNDANIFLVGSKTIVHLIGFSCVKQWSNNSVNVNPVHRSITIVHPSSDWSEGHHKFIILFWDAWSYTKTTHTFVLFYLHVYFFFFGFPRVALAIGERFIKNINRLIMTTSNKNFRRICN